ncbi:Uncharacterized protein DBV15_06515 [Temnothorax longispinosus]|uniref:Dynein axonemal light chain 1 n=1 Tax=Temnothorax longispinosus TaxID=300112 RepID=A0A4S2KA40_9HYME|nr:Uncharacterized protein DBV15_06515 [Temnothorax longispinosus]
MIRHETILAKATTCKEAIQRWEEKTGLVASEQKEIILSFQWPPIERMDNSLAAKLSLSTNVIEKISGINSLKYLRILSLSRNNIKTFSGLEAIGDHLEELWISYNLIEKIKGVNALKALKVLYMGNNLVKDWAEFNRLQEIPNLQDLLFINNPICENMDAESWRAQVVRRLPGLKKLDAIPVMTELKKCNSQLFKELSETKSNLENVKAKWAQCKHSTPADYQPGMLSELVREIREANRNCEEGLITKVKFMLEEKCNQQVKEVDELKNQLAKLMKEKEESDQRVAKLEEEVTALKLSATNEDREIAVFEEENLALRRELQEARACRTMAENAAKCVNFAVSRSVTPVTFDTPCITSTPVRTALTDTCFPLPAIPPASHTSSSASSVLRSRSAEVAAFQPTSEVDQCQNFATDSEPVSCEESPTKESAWKRAEMFLASCHTTITCMNDDVTSFIDIIAKQESGRQTITCMNDDVTSFIDIIAKQESGVMDNGTLSEILSEIDLGDCLEFYAKEARDVMRNDGKIKSTTTEAEKRTKVLLTDIPEESTDDQLGIYDAKMLSMLERDGANDLGSSGVLEEETDLPDKLSDCASKAEKLTNHSDNHSFWQKLCKFRNQRGSFKKPRRKKGNSRKLFSESDEDPSQDQTKILMADMVPPGSPGSDRDTANEDGDCFPNNDRTNHGTTITDVPDVVVIGGGSIVPKDLCSTRTLTSRTQTAPSRATYTCLLYTSRCSAAWLSAETFALLSAKEFVGQVFGCISKCLDALAVEKRHVVPKPARTNVTLEKLEEILRKKVNGATATETVSRIFCDVASGACPVPEDQAEEPTNQVLSLSSSSEDEQDEAEDGDDDDDDDDEKPDTSRSDKNSSIASDSKITLVIDGSKSIEQISQYYSSRGLIEILRRNRVRRTESLHTNHIIDSINYRQIKNGE